MSDDIPADDGQRPVDSTDDSTNLSTAAVASPYKVLGEFTDATGVGVLGQNNAGSGTPIGVRGAVPNASGGYGLYTADDAYLEGVIDTGETDFEVVAGTTTTDDARNVVLGHAFNDAIDGAVGATIAGGGFDDGSSARRNTVSDNYGTVGGGWENLAGSTDGDPTNAEFATVGGGSGNGASGFISTVGGGYQNSALEQGATVAGGESNAANRVYSSIGGGLDNRAEAIGATVGGGHLNDAGAEFATIAGGGPDAIGDDTTNNVVYDDYGTIGGGNANQAGTSDGDSTTAEFATVGGGRDNTAAERYTTVAGGVGNAASDTHATIGGGYGHVASGWASTVAGGNINEASDFRASVGGGEGNSATGDSATVPGGKLNAAQGDYSFAAGREATAANAGSFVWGDGTSNAVQDAATDQVVFQAGGGMSVYTDSDTSTNTGAELPAGSGSWSSLSSESAKSNVSSTDPERVLQAVENIEIATWEYDAQGGVTHMGPMAEDFHDQFGLGGDEQRISTVDADGVALAAIQGLAERLAEKDERIDAQSDRIDELESRLDEFVERDRAVSADD